VPLTHSLPEWWTNPSEFDPERFSDERAEHKRHRFSWVPFGGAHMCLGMHFAYMLVKAILHPLLASSRLTVADGYQMQYQQVPIPKPKDRLPLTLEPIA
jgi:cytochrome P450